MRDMMHRLVLSLALAFGLAGLTACATAPPADLAIQRLLGQPAQVAFGYLGLPHEEQVIAGTRMYVWSEGGIATTPVYRPPRRHRERDTWVFDAPYFDEVPRSYACTLRLFVDERDMVTGGDVQGHGGGCSDFAHALAPLSAPR